MSLYNLFPPPEYLAMPSIGLDISDRSVKYLSFSNRGGRIRLDRFGKKDIPEGIIDGGIIKKRDEFVSFLAALRREVGIKSVAVSLPEEKAFLHVAQLPAVDPARVRETIEMQLEELVPLPPSETAFDFEILPSGEDKDHLDVLVAAYSKIIINEYNSALQDAGIMPLVFEIEAQSLARAAVPRDELDTIMIIDFGKTRTSFLIVSGGYLRFTSTVAVGGGSLDQAIGKNLNVNIYEAEKIKKERAFVTTIGGDPVAAAILPIVAAIKDEADRSINFWEGHAGHVHVGGGMRIKKILLCGGDANLIGLKEYLSSNLKIKTEFANVWTNVASFEEYVPEIKFNTSLSYATVVGLGLRALKI